jgi:hypothetical protein
VNGTLDISAQTAAIPITGVINVESGATLKGNAHGISGAGAIVIKAGATAKVDAGDFVVPGAKTDTSRLTLSSGALALNATGYSLDGAASLHKDFGVGNYATLEVKSGAVLTVETGITFTVNSNATLNLAGTLALRGTSKVAISNIGKLAATATGVLAADTVTTGASIKLFAAAWEAQDTKTGFAITGSTPDFTATTGSTAGAVTAVIGTSSFANGVATDQASAGVTSTAVTAAAGSLIAGTGTTLTLSL